MPQIRLSRTQIKEVDRVGGIELLILWPVNLLGPAPAAGAMAGDRDAGMREKAAAELLIGEDCQRHGLVPVHASTTRQPRPMFAAAPTG